MGGTWAGAVQSHAGGGCGGSVINNLDRFSAAFLSAGAIKATLLTVSGNPQAASANG